MRTWTERWVGPSLVTSLAVVYQVGGFHQQEETAVAMEKNDNRRWRRLSYLKGSYSDLLVFVQSLGHLFLSVILTFLPTIFSDLPSSFHASLAFLSQLTQSPLQQRLTVSLSLHLCSSGCDSAFKPTKIIHLLNSKLDMFSTSQRLLSPEHLTFSYATLALPFLSLNQ